MTTTSNADQRLQGLEQWLASLPGPPVRRVTPASVDASFRRYFRVHRDDGTQIAMDAPPEREGLDTYLQVAGLLAGTGLHVPEVLAADAKRGYVLISDLGNLQYLEALNKGADPEPLYADAIDALLQLQDAGTPDAGDLPLYDDAMLRREMELFPEWFIGRHLGLQANADDRRAIASAFDWLCGQALAQPVVLVHRDYHSRNLMVCTHRNPGILDFQDAVRGPIAYDLVSLLKDCYIAWPRARVESWVEAYRQRVGALAAGAGPEEFLRWFDLIGLQRHIKVLGVFARLWYRDGKNGYLGDLPRVLDYVRDTAARYPELAEFSAWVEGRLAPGLAAANARALAGAGR